MKCADPLNPNHSGLVNIYTGFVAENAVNVYDSVKTGKQQQSHFQESWPEGFYATIKKEVKNMKMLKKKHPKRR